jgi:hypothetical protein
MSESSPSGTKLELEELATAEGIGEENEEVAISAA